jgi:hypothetical protein
VDGRHSADKAASIVLYKPIRKQFINEVWALRIHRSLGQLFSAGWNSQFLCQKRILLQQAAGLVETPRVDERICGLRRIRHARLIGADCAVLVTQFEKGARCSE